MHFVYIDDSGDEKHRCFSALIVHEAAWKDAQLRIRNHRRALKRSDGMYVTKELHANEFVAGRGKIAVQVVPKGRRCQIFGQTLEIIASLPNTHLMNAFSSKANERVIFERLVNRINRSMAEWKSHAVIFHDEGKDFTRLVRRMCIYNPIRSRYGAWPGGSPYKNIPIDRVLEDIVYRDSKQSSFIQMVDFCAYALFRSEVLLASKSKYGLDKAFEALHPICIRAACNRDPRRLGIIRM